jgi:hypothetical protein
MGSPVYVAREAITANTRLPGYGGTWSTSVREALR